ncbi:MAG: response regulator [Treponema sp.]|nr:response regulator [Treponema sp.]
MNEVTELEKKFIILVDDNPATLQSAMNVLSSNKRVATAPSAVKLFELLETNVPDIILLDIDMPEVDGYQIIKILKFKKTTKDIPVIFLTGKAEPNEELMGLSLGAVDYITKPFHPSLLVKRVDMHLLMEDQKRKLEKQSVELADFNDNLQKLVHEKVQNALSLQDVLLNAVTELSKSRDDLSEGNIDRAQQRIKSLLDLIKNSKAFSNN